MTLVERYTFGDVDHVALRMLPCTAERVGVDHYVMRDDRPDLDIGVIGEVGIDGPAPESRQVRRARERAEEKAADKMRGVKRWICWRPVPDRKDPRKINKIPIDPFTSQPFEEGSGWQTDPARWASFDDAAANGRLLGFVLGDGWTGLDFDDCIVNGKLAPWVARIVQALGSYAEVSPSRTGIKIFLQGTRLEGAKSVLKCAAWGWEIYDGRRFFTVTGDRLPDAPATIAERTAMLQKITDTIWGDDLVGLCKLRDLFLRASGDNVHIRCPWEAEHTHGNGEKDTGLLIKDGRVIGFHCFHAHCADRTLRDIRKWFGITGGQTHPLTEAGDAECFADLYSDQVRYDHRRGRWLVSDVLSGIWVPDPVERLTQMAIGMARERQHQANAIESADKKKAAWTWGFKGEGRARITNTLALARSVPPIADPGEDWDTHPFLIGVQNGVVDLETGTFRKATAADRVTMRVRVAYDPAARCPLWLRTLSEIFAPTDLTADSSQVMVDFMQRAIGYSITGDCREECCFFTWGAGGNGKGVTMNTLGWLFGDYTDDMPYSTLERSDRGSAIPNDVAKLLGKRFITCAEVNEFSLNEARLKALTGRDPMTARFLHKEFFTFIPVCKIWIATNNKPQILGQDDGIWRRIHLIPFTQNFEGRENKQLKDQLRAELPGILNWIIAGAGLWLRDGLNPPETVKAATAAYRHESNPITPFIDARCVIRSQLRAQAALTFKAYEEFCRDENIEPWKRLSNKAFFKAMEERFEADKSGRQTFYLGVGLREMTLVQSDIDDSMVANPEPEDEVPF